MNSRTDSLPRQDAEQKREAMARRFHALAERWKRETRFLSNVAKKCMHPAYQGIIGLGVPALPLILEELRREPTDWFWALTAISGENPI
jgi:hypothetical protein